MKKISAVSILVLLVLILGGCQVDPGPSLSDDDVDMLEYKIDMIGTEIIGNVYSETYEGHDVLIPGEVERWYLEKDTYLGDDAIESWKEEFLIWGDVISHDEKTDEWFLNGVKTDEDDPVLIERMESFTSVANSVTPYSSEGVTFSALGGTAKMLMETDGISGVMTITYEGAYPTLDLLIHFHWNDYSYVISDVELDGIPLTDAQINDHLELFMDLVDL